MGYDVRVEKRCYLKNVEVLKEGKIDVRKAKIIY
jgi:hypothetical protein